MKKALLALLLLAGAAHASTPTSTFTASPTVTQTFTVSPTLTITGTFTSTVTPTPSPTITQTFTVSPTSTNTPTATPSPTPVEVAPVGVSLGILQPDNTQTLYWTAVAAATQWQVYLDGNLKYNVAIGQVAVQTPGTYSYLMHSLPQGGSHVLTMTAGAPGQQWSASSSPVTVTTAGAPFSYSWALGTQPVGLASLTFTAVGAAATGVVVVAAIPGKTITVVGYTMSSDASIRMTLHHQAGAALRSNTVSNIIGGGLYTSSAPDSPAFSGFYSPGLAANQPVCVDFSGAANVEVVVRYVTN